MPLVLRAAAAGLAIFLTARVLWTAASTESGFSFLGQQWKRATLGWFVDTDPITAKPGIEQAEFWLAEIDRVLEEAKDEDAATRARLTMGAALTLDQLQVNEDAPEQHYLISSMPRWFGPNHRISADSGSYAAITQTKSHLADRIWELANRAVSHEPDNPDWHRLRVLFSMRRADDANWREVLEAAQQADPENPLHDFVLAERLFRNAMTAEWANTTIELEILDEDLLAEALQVTDRGIAKGKCEFGQHADSALFAFLERSSLPRFAFREYAEIPPQVHDLRASFGQPTYHMYRLVEYARIHDLDPRPGIDLERRIQSVYAAIDYDPQNRSKSAAALMRTMKGTTKDNGEPFFSAEEISELAALIESSAIEVELKRRTEGLHAARYDSFAAHEKKTFVSRDVADLFAILAPDSIGLLLLLAVLLWAVSRWRRTEAERRLQTPRACRFLPQLAYLGTALFLAYIVFGTLPSWLGEIMTSEAFAVAAIGTPMLGLIGFLWLVWRRGFRFQLSRLLIVLALAPIAFMGFFHLLLNYSNGGLATLWDIPSIAFGSENPRSLATKLAPGVSEWLPPVIQVLLYGGLHWAALIFLGILSLAYYGAVESSYRKTRKKKGDKKDTTLERLDKKSVASEQRWKSFLLHHTRQLAGISCRGLLLAALVFYFAYAWFVPALLHSQDHQFQLALRPIRDAAQVEAEMMEIRTELWEDEQVRSEIRADVDAWIQANTGG